LTLGPSLAIVLVLEGEPTSQPLREDCKLQIADFKLQIAGG